jgi:Werner syndrome ATP-dependent helicase
MNGNGVSSDQVIAKLLEMGFENSNAMEAVKEAGPSFDDALGYILNGGCRNNQRASSSSRCSTSKVKAPGKRALPSSNPLGQIRQSSILDHFQSSSRPKRSRTDVVPYVSVSGSEKVHGPVDQCVEVLSELPPVDCLDIGSDWQKKANSLLQKHFGYLSLKSFQKEVLAAWFAHKDTLVLAATGSGITILLMPVSALLILYYMSVYVYS